MASTNLDLFPTAEGSTSKLATLTPLTSREIPALWVKTMAVYREWQPSKDTEMRVFYLRRGLNILWADPAIGASADNRLGGHGAGKSTFCRLLRHLVCESKAGTGEFLDEFRSHFRSGWVVGEVIVDQKPWVVGRPLGGAGHHSFAFQSEFKDFEFPENPPRQGFAEYQLAIQNAVFRGEDNMKLPESKKRLTWEKMLPWFTRDQEAHYSGLLEWRHKDSDHDSPSVSHEDRGHIVRMVLGIMDSEEKKLLSRLSTASKEHERLIRERPQEERVVLQDRNRLSLALGGMEVVGEELPVLQYAVTRKVDELKGQVNLTPARERHKTEAKILEAKVDSARFSYTVATSQLESVEDQIRLEKARLSGTKPAPKRKKEYDPHIAALNMLGPFPGYCSHEMTREWKKTCPIAHEREADDVTEETEEFKEESEKKSSEIVELEKRLTSLKKQVEARRVPLENATKALDNLRQAHQIEIAELSRPGKEAAAIESLHTSFVESEKALKDWDTEIGFQAQEKKNIELELSDQVKQHDKAIEKFEQIFNEIAKRLVSKKASGKVGFKGKSISPELFLRGKRNSAALKLAKWLAFDLTSLVYGAVHEKSLHPRFLVHDSPREADLANNIYAELFRIVHELENCLQSEDGYPAFQYFVTTTEGPPSELRKKPWLLQPILSSASGETRLLGIDLDADE
ncbi:MAG: hypothetical protein P1U86_05755 [Verrucomicrobiales bacterium]|nr:hypothetical protein [Verrucomicrobiales bacterium]